MEVRIKLAPALAEEFFAVAEGRGLLPATLAATALGEYVERQRQQASIVRLVALDTSKRMSEAMSDPEALVKLVAAAIASPGVVEAISSMACPEGE